MATVSYIDTRILPSIVFGTFDYLKQNTADADMILSKELDGMFEVSVQRGVFDFLKDDSDIYSIADIKELAEHDL